MNCCEVSVVKIKWIEFENLRTGLKIKRIEFNEDVTLLVGLSGAGKTQILNAVRYSLKLAVSKNITLQPYYCKLCLEINEVEYEWEYCIKEDAEKVLLVDSEEKYYFSKEILCKNGEILFKRDENEIYVISYKKVPTPKKNESLLVQYAEEISFKGMIQDIRKMCSIEVEMNSRLGIDKENFLQVSALTQIYCNGFGQVKFDRFNNFPVILKLYIAKEHYTELYCQIINSIQELFAEIEDIEVKEEPLTKKYVIAIQVYNKILMQNEISSGMLKVIYYIVELFTMPENTVVLIDEFENGLGVNCIDTLAEMLTTERADLQFIITSHHPKVINGIDKNKWKIIDREISTIRNSNCNQYGIGNSQHDAYFNLINRWEFEGKV